MKALVNKHIFSEAALDSGSLTILCQVVHQFDRPGEFQGAVMMGRKKVGAFILNVVEDSKQMQSNIDLEEVTKSFNRVGSIGCGFFKETPKFTVCAKGYVVFFVSNGPGGYSVKVGSSKEEIRSSVFDSTKLDNGDFFCATIMRPGEYMVSNSITNTKGRLIVEYPEPGKKLQFKDEPPYIQCKSDGFAGIGSPQNELAKIPAAQGLAFKIETPSRIKIAIRKPTTRKLSKAESKRVGWKRPPA